MLTRILDQLTPNILSTIHKHGPETTVGIFTGILKIPDREMPSIDLLVNEILNQLKNCCSFCGGFLLYFLKYWRKVVLVRAIFRETEVKRVVKLRLKSGKEIEYKKCKFSSIAVKIMEKSVVKLN